MTKPDVLIVDDDVDGCTILARLLAAYGYRADIAHDGPAALALAERTPYAIAIVDYHMPGMNGVELFRRLRRAQPDMAGIFLTGYTTIDVVFPAIEAGVLHVLSKPPDFRELISIIDAQVGVTT